MKRGPDNILPQSLAPRGLSREQAAAYVGVSPSLFDTLVRDGRMPEPKRINARTVWDRLQLDAAFAALPSNEAPVNPWDEIAAWKGVMQVRFKHLVEIVTTTAMSASTFAYLDGARFASEHLSERTNLSPLTMPRYRIT